MLPERVGGEWVSPALLERSSNPKQVVGSLAGRVRDIECVVAQIHSTAVYARLRNRQRREVISARQANAFEATISVRAMVPRCAPNPLF